MIQLTILTIALFGVSRIESHSLMTVDEIYRIDPNYPPELHSHIQAELAAGNRAELETKFRFDFDAYGAAYEARVNKLLEARAAIIREGGGEVDEEEESARFEEFGDDNDRRRLVTSAPVPAPSAYSLPPTPSGSGYRTTSPTDSAWIAVDFEQMISHKDANIWCREQYGSGNVWSEGTFTATYPYGGSAANGATVLGGVDPGNPHVDYDASTVEGWNSAMDELKALCIEIDNGPCWIGAFWRYNTKLWRWRGHGSEIVPPSPSPTTEASFWAPNEPKTTFDNVNMPDLYCAVLEPSQGYKVVSVDCIPSATNPVKVGICYNLFWSP